jgi:hypothetical protein
MLTLDFAVYPIVDLPLYTVNEYDQRHWTSFDAL